MAEIFNDVTASCHKPLRTGSEPEAIVFSKQGQTEKLDFLASVHVTHVTIMLASLAIIDVGDVRQ